jgi:hypothetical protein
MAEAVSGHMALSLNMLAAAGVGCCVVLLLWWMYLQTASRCADCGFCPAWCRCGSR